VPVEKLHLHGGCGEYCGLVDYANAAFALGDHGAAFIAYERAVLVNPWNFEEALNAWAANLMRCGDIPTTVTRVVGSYTVIYIDDTSALRCGDPVAATRVITRFTDSARRSAAGGMTLTIALLHQSLQMQIERQWSPALADQLASVSAEMWALCQRLASHGPTVGGQFVCPEWAQPLHK
jgi:hypothetical protein